MLMHMAPTNYKLAGEPRILRDANLEGIAAQLCTAVQHDNPGTVGIKYQYHSSPQNVATGTADLNSDSVVVMLTEYIEKGQYIEDRPSMSADSFDGTSQSNQPIMPIRHPLEIRVNQGVVTNDIYLTGEVHDAHEMFSGYGFHRSNIKKKLMENRVAQFFSKYLLSKSAKQQLKKKLKAWADRIDEINSKPLYLELERLVPDKSE